MVQQPVHPATNTARPAFDAFSAQAQLKALVEQYPTNRTSNNMLLTTNTAHIPSQAMYFQANAVGT